MTLDYITQSGQSDLLIEKENCVATVTIRRPPHNFFDSSLISRIAKIFETLDQMADCRAIVLAAEGKSFCAGSDFSKRQDLTNAPDSQGEHIYKAAVRLFRIRKPIIAAVHGAAVGGGLGLALIADFRVCCPEARFSANFNRIGIHPGFGLTATLPRVIGAQRASLLFYTGRRITGNEAANIGLVDVLVPQAEVLEAARALAQEIAQSAPLAVQSTHETMRRGLADAVSIAIERECMEQDWQRSTADFREGTKAMFERRKPKFLGA
ncbi:enoyl-CoA hydratase/isomerase family protein [Candidatus Nitrotoga sp. M5]|uniref:enoyl-CoA hydratase/isomerase family protein n=1 Tax=Candidatus Nitrotoga sp. M5 TaxID=2890409 RepID=UPI001EF50152|nr:enoyl-CoA hydratase/isomerase family protein [Candidatus Nitrotoga sp. M5]CAH1387512.1 Enoyl-CoA hydratase [Candidatus Nitrotoga sp. M5]